MASAKIEVRKSRSAAEITDLIDAVYQAVREALKVPEDDNHIRYIEHKPEHFAVPPGNPENRTFVEITLFPGRSLDAKRKLYQSIVQRFGELGIVPSDIFIVLNEPSLDNWGIRGVPASEIDLGFKLDV